MMHIPLSSNPGCGIGAPSGATFKTLVLPRRMQFFWVNVRCTYFRRNRWKPPVVHKNASISVGPRHACISAIGYALCSTFQACDVCAHRRQQLQELTVLSFKVDGTVDDAQQCGRCAIGCAFFVNKYNAHLEFAAVREEQSQFLVGLYCEQSQSWNQYVSAFVRVGARGHTMIMSPI
jgi:hypothetical protein